nr:hypothetical protein CFP56_59767 [Quercus suber]
MRMLHVEHTSENVASSLYLFFVVWCCELSSLSSDSEPFSLSLSLSSSSCVANGDEEILQRDQGPEGEGGA